MSGKQFAIVVTITFIVGMIWLISDIIFNTKASIPISPTLETSLAPVNPNFNGRVLEIIDKEVADSDLTQLTTKVTPATPEATLEESPISTQSAQTP